MKVAVASNDGTSIAEHFGHCASWLVFDVEGAQVAQTEKRANAHGEHGQTDCRGGGPHQGQHKHAGILRALKGCEAVISAGIGRRVAEDLEKRGIRPYVVNLPCTPEEAIARLAAGELENADRTFCRGRHGQCHGKQ